MDKYRKMYNENLLGTSDVSILKFYYASFKIQYNKGKITSLSDFLDECAKISDDTNRLLKLFGFLPLVNLCFGTGREQKRIAEIIRTKREDVEKLFIKDDITDNDIESLLYDISKHEENTKTTKEYLELIKEKIIKCYSINGWKQIGDRIFGYLAASELLSAYTPMDRLRAWHNLIGDDIIPSDTRLHTNPSLNRSKVDAKTLLKNLDTIREFYAEIGLTKIVGIIQKDIDTLSGKA
jgi:hypothetical protein